MEDFLEIIKNCKFIAIEKVPQFNDTNSNQQKRFITLLDVIYDKGIPLAITAKAVDCIADVPIFL